MKSNLNLNNVNEYPRKVSIKQKNTILIFSKVKINLDCKKEDKKECSKISFKKINNILKIIIKIAFS